jgi:hypothetical protein
MKKFIGLIGLCLFVFQTYAQDFDIPQVDTVSVMPPTKKGIVLAGSSITWGGGSIMDRFSGQVVDFIQNELASTIICSGMKFTGTVTDYNNPLQYKGVGKKISGLNSKIEFDLFGDEIAICQTKLRTSDYAVIQVKADGKIIGIFANHNENIGNETQQFTGDGNTVKFQLKYPATYSHVVKIEGKLQRGEIYTGGWSRKVPENPGYLVVRKFDENHKPTHFVFFKTAPKKGAKIVVTYKYGRIVAFEGSTIGQLANNEKNETPYGEGTVSFDPTNPAVLSSGLEYRYIDKKAFWIHKFLSAKKRHFEIKIINGENPYFIINFASNRFHNYMNAGIGGWKLANLLDKDGINDYNDFFLKFTPDILVNESATNDDWAFGERKIKRTLTGLSEKEVKQLWTLELDKVTYNKKSDDYTVRLCTGIISKADQFSLICPQIVKSNVVPGDIIRIGNYHGDNHQVVCREIETVDLQKGKVTWLNPLTPEQILNVNSYNDLIGAECAVRDLSDYQNQYEELITHIQKISPQTQILIVQPGLSNYRRRALWGYNIIHHRLAANFHNVNTIEVTDWLYDFQKGNISGKSFIEIEANGSDEYILPWKGHWQGFEVWVDNNNLYGTDCYIDGGYGYSVNQETSENELKVEKMYDKSYTVNRKMRLVFTKNAPIKGKIKILKADSVWSEDYCHTNNIGKYIYGQIYITRLKDLINYK